MILNICLKINKMYLKIKKNNEFRSVFLPSQTYCPAVWLQAVPGLRKQAEEAPAARAVARGERRSLPPGAMKQSRQRAQPDVWHVLRVRGILARTFVIMCSAHNKLCISLINTNKMFNITKMESH